LTAIPKTENHGNDDANNNHGLDIIVFP
jgi:hypothetical protein